MTTRKALTDAAEVRRELEKAVRKAIEALGHIPEQQVIAVLPDDQLQAIIDHHTGGLFVY